MRKSVLALGLFALFATIAASASWPWGAQVATSGPNVNQAAVSWARSYDSLRDLVVDAEVIAVVGNPRVTDSWTLDAAQDSRDPSKIEVMFDVMDVWQGTSAETIAVEMYGAPDGSATFAEEPPFDANGSYVLFLRQSRDPNGALLNRYWVLGPWGRLGLMDDKVSLVGYLVPEAAALDSIKLAAIPLAEFKRMVEAAGAGGR